VSILTRFHQCRLTVLVHQKRDQTDNTCTARDNSLVPYLIHRLHIRSLGYQQLSSGFVSILTCFC
jgi:hypothetical protein